MKMMCLCESLSETKQIKNQIKNEFRRKNCLNLRK